MDYFRWVRQAKKTAEKPAKSHTYMSDEEKRRIRNALKTNTKARRKRPSNVGENIAIGVPTSIPSVRGALGIVRRNNAIIARSKRRQTKRINRVIKKANRENQKAYNAYARKVRQSINKDYKQYLNRFNKWRRKAITARVKQEQAIYAYDMKRIKKIRKITEKAFDKFKMSKRRFPYDTGNMRNQSNTYPTIDGAVIDIPVIYAEYLEKGTKPHDIPHAFGRPLPFGIGGRYSGKFHPGSKKWKGWISKGLYPYMISAITNACRKQIKGVVSVDVRRRPLLKYDWNRRFAKKGSNGQ